MEAEFIGLKNGILNQTTNVLIMNNQLMVIDWAINEYEMIDKCATFNDFKVILAYSGISKSLIWTDFNN